MIPAPRRIGPLAWRGDRRALWRDRSRILDRGARRGRRQVLARGGRLRHRLSTLPRRGGARRRGGAAHGRRHGALHRPGLGGGPRPGTTPRGRGRPRPGAGLGAGLRPGRLRAGGGRGEPPLRRPRRGAADRARRGRPRPARERARAARAHPARARTGAADRGECGGDHRRPRDGGALGGGPVRRRGAVEGAHDASRGSGRGPAARPFGARMARHGRGRRCSRGSARGARRHPSRAARRGLPLR